VQFKVSFKDMADIQDDIREVKAEIASAKTKRNKAEEDGEKELVLAYTNEISELLRKEDRLSRSSGNTTFLEHNILLFEYKQHMHDDIACLFCVNPSFL
jgi:hypothetical protein